MEEETQGLILLVVSCLFVGAMVFAVAHYHPVLLQEVTQWFSKRPTSF